MGEPWIIPNGWHIRPGNQKEGNLVKLRDAVASNYSMAEVISEIRDFDPDIIIIETNFSSLTHDISVVNDIKTRLNRKIISIITGPRLPYFRIKLSQTIVSISWPGTNMILLLPIW